MNAKTALKSNLDLGLLVLNTYLGDLSDADLLRRPAPGCNHLAWQLGHLISSEAFLLNAICPGQAAELPANFAERHAKEATGVDDPAQFCSRQEYQELYQKVRAATLAALEALPDENLDLPSPEHFRSRFPTVAQMFTLIGSHPLMHAGQFVVVRRQLGKPILI